MVKDVCLYIFLELSNFFSSDLSYRLVKVQTVSVHCIISFRAPRTGSVPCDRGVGEGVHEADLPAITSAFIRLAQGVVDAIWLDLGALNQG